MQAPLEIRYAGVIIGRAQEVRTAEGEAMFFLPGKEPMPVGTLLHLRSGKGEAPARVVRAVESPDPAICGMQVRLVGEEEVVATEFIPEPAPAKPKASPPPPVAPPPEASSLAPVAPPPETPTPTQPVDVAALEAEAAKLSQAPAPESTGVPEAVPVAVGSSLTGALAKAAATTEATAPAPEAASAAPTRTPVASDDLDIVITNTPPPISPSSVVPVLAPFESEPAAPPPTAEDAAPASAATAEESQAAAGETGDENGGEEPAAGGNGPSTEQLPTARAISGPSSRRKTKRRR
jgi:hypothetical protein